MSSAEKARATREANKRRAAENAAIERYAAMHGLTRRGIAVGVYANNQRCRDCGTAVHSVQIFRDGAGSDVRVCLPCVRVAVDGLS